MANNAETSWREDMPALEDALGSEIGSLAKVEDLIAQLDEPLREIRESNERAAALYSDSWEKATEEIVGLQQKIAELNGRLRAGGSEIAQIATELQAAKVEAKQAFDELMEERAQHASTAQRLAEHREAGRNLSFQHEDLRRHVAVSEARNREQADTIRRQGETIRRLQQNCSDLSRRLLDAERQTRTSPDSSAPATASQPEPAPGAPVDADGSVKWVQSWKLDAIDDRIRNIMESGDVLTIHERLGVIRRDLARLMLDATPSSTPSDAERDRAAMVAWLAGEGGATGLVDAVRALQAACADVIDNAEIDDSVMAEVKRRGEIIDYLLEGGPDLHIEVPAPLPAQPSIERLVERIDVAFKAIREQHERLATVEHKIGEQS